MEFECEYRPASGAMVAFIVFAGLMLLFALGARAPGETGGPGSSIQTTYGMLGLLFGGLAAVALVVRCAMDVRPARIALTADAVLIPRSRWSRREIAVENGHLHEVYRSSWYGQSFINIVHSQGKLMVPIAALPSAEVFHELLDRLQARVAGEQEEGTGQA